MNQPNLASVHLARVAHQLVPAECGGLRNWDYG